MLALRRPLRPRMLRLTQGARVQEDVPLFPLNVVLFPGMPLPLHIFEPRYREMMALCTEEERPFAVLLIQEGLEVGTPAKPFEIGTMAKIVGVEKLEDGRLNIVTVGTDRFHLLRYSAEKRSYLVGDVEVLEDKSNGEAIPPELREEIAALANRYVALLNMASGQELVAHQLPSEPTALSYSIGANLRIDNLERQQLLETTSTANRLRKEKDLLQREIKTLDEYLRQRKRGSLGPFSRN